MKAAWPECRGARELGEAGQALSESGSWGTGRLLRRLCLKGEEKGTPMMIESGQEAGCPETVSLLLKQELE